MKKLFLVLMAMVFVVSLMSCEANGTHVHTWKNLCSDSSIDEYSKICSRCGEKRLIATLSYQGDGEESGKGLIKYIHGENMIREEHYEVDGITLSSIDEYVFTYDGNGRLIKAVNTFKGEDEHVILTASYLYEYDNKGRLIGKQYIGTEGDVAAKYTYSYEGGIMEQDFQMMDPDFPMHTIRRKVYDTYGNVVTDNHYIVRRNGVIEPDTIESFDYEYDDEGIAVSSYVYDWLEEEGTSYSFTYQKVPKE